jgi:hypothetical protein
MESDIISLLMRRIRERMDAVEQALAAGAARSYEEYCRLVGGYAAMREFEDDIKELEKRYLDE